MKSVKSFLGAPVELRVSIMLFVKARISSKVDESRPFEIIPIEPDAGNAAVGKHNLNNAFDGVPSH